MTDVSLDFTGILSSVLELMMTLMGAKSSDLDGKKSNNTASDIQSWPL